MAKVFAPIERALLQKKGFPEHGIKTTKTLVHDIRKHNPAAWRLFCQLTRFVAMQNAISNQKAKGRYRHNPAHDTLRKSIRDILQKLLNHGMGNMREVIAHCKSYQVFP